MRVLLLFNPVAGTGEARQAAALLQRELQACGHEARIEPTQRIPAHHWLDTLLVQVELLVIVGGDGAIRQCLGAASRADVPIYQFPFGTENLFAREFEMTQRTDHLLDVIEARSIQTVDVGRANGRWFGLMASVGLDAEVVHHLASIRRGAISHRSYLVPTITEFMRYRAQPFQVCVDGVRVDDERPCFVVIGNCREYGWRLNPAYLADMTDGLLDVAVFPTMSRLSLASWAVRARLGRLNRARSLYYTRGTQVEITCSTPFRYQLDGDPPGTVDDPNDTSAAATGEDLVERLEVEVVPGGLRVLAPRRTTA